MLKLVFYNDWTGDETFANYDVVVKLDNLTIANCRLEHFSRRTGWRALVRQFVAELTEGTPEPGDDPKAN